MSLPKIRLERCYRAGDGLWRLDDAQARHLVRSLRSYEGAAVEGLLPDGGGTRFLMRLERDGGEYFLRTVSEEPEVSDGVAITLLIGLLKSSQFDVVLSGASELGIKRIIPALCERSIPRIEPAERAKKLARWRKILDEGTSVSGSIFPTAIDSLCAFSEIDWNLMPDARYAAVISRDSRPISEARAYGVEVAFAVGPEGDWSDSETCVLMEHGFIPVTLGNRIMKASTAVIAGCGWFRLSCF